jgi:hypothetical protein
MMDFLTLALILIVVGLMLEKWEPPLKNQYQFCFIGLLGVILGHYLPNVDGFWGFILAGIVFYKGEVIREFREVKEGLEEIREKG